MVVSRGHLDAALVVAAESEGVTRWQPEEVPT
jgi:hypothetical protein